MIKELFFDTDCISSFLWVKQENLLLQLYPGRIVLSYQVFIELSNPSIPHSKRKISVLCSNGDVSTMKIMLGTEEYRLFYEIAFHPPRGEIVLGKGEAAALALAKVHNGIVASNNMKDIKRYIEKLKLNHIATGDILVEAMIKGLIDENTGNQIWDNMLSKQRLLPAATFSDFLKLR
jgi:predicted nucleic acid-binding protein